MNARDTAQQSVMQGRCNLPPMGCGNAVRPDDFTDPVSVREYRITGMCQSCQDLLYAYMEEAK